MNDAGAMNQGLNPIVGPCSFQFFLAQPGLQRSYNEQWLFLSLWLSTILFLSYPLKYPLFATLILTNRPLKIQLLS